MTGTVDPFADWDAAYVLGMLGAAQRREFELHLTTCDSCRAAVTELAGMPGILSVLGPEDAVALDAAPSEDRLRDQAHQPGVLRLRARNEARRRRRMRWRIGGLTAAVAALGIVGGILIGTAVISPTSQPAGSSQTASPSAQVPMAQVTPGVMTATLGVTAAAWGTRLDWTCHYVDGAWTGGGSAPSYALVVTDTSGHRTTVATWTASGPTAAGLTASTSIPESDIRSVDIRTVGSSTPLVQRTLAGGS
jgi:hypothetical protein